MNKKQERKFKLLVMDIDNLLSNWQKKHREWLYRKDLLKLNSNGEIHLNFSLDPKYFQRRKIEYGYVAIKDDEAEEPAILVAGIAEKYKMSAELIPGDPGPRTVLVYKIKP